MRSLALALLILGIVFGSTPATSGGVNTLTGVWAGSFTCKTEDANGKGSFKESESDLLISQTVAGGPLILLIDGTPYSGTVIPSAADPNEGAGAFIACGTSDGTINGVLNEVETIHWKIDPTTGSGTIKKSGAFSTNEVQVGTCKGSWRRVNTNSPKVVACDDL